MTKVKKKSICTVDADGTESWTCDGFMHREDGPAFIRPDGYRQWNVNGLIHRNHGPAVEYPGGERWVNHGRLHRLGGPAITMPDGTKKWYIKDKLHRTDGPAVMHGDGRVDWFLHGQQVLSDRAFQRLTSCSDEYLAMLVLKYGAIRDSR